MSFTEKDRNLIRLAYHSKSPDLRSRTLSHLSGTQKKRARLEQHTKTASKTPFAKRMIRLAYTTTDPVLRRGILESIRIAAYQEEFLNTVKGQKFHNPETGNKILFVSLPEAEQSKIYQQWSAAQQAQPQAPKKPKKVKKPTFAQARKDVFSALAEAGWSMKTHLKIPKAEKDINGHKVVLQFKPQAVYLELKGETPSHSLGVDLRDVDPKEWEASLEQEVEKSLDLQKKIQDLNDEEVPKPEKLHDGWFAQKPEVSKPEPAKNPGLIDKDFPNLSDSEDKALSKDLNEVLESWETTDYDEDGTPLSKSQIVENLGQKYYGDKFDDHMHEAILQTLSDTFNSMAVNALDVGDENEAAHYHFFIDGIQKKIKKLKKPKPENSAESPKPEEKKPTGKHKDRKELRSKPKKKMSDPARVSDQLATVLTKTMSEAQKKKTNKKLEDASFATLSSLLEHTSHALSNPDGSYALALKDAGYTPEILKETHSELSKALAPALGKKYHPEVLRIANLHDLEQEDADALAAFKTNKPHAGKPLTPQELFNKFMAKAAPETKERMQGMPLNDFMAMYNAIMADEEEERKMRAKAETRLPQSPHHSVQDARESGVLAGGEEESISIFDPPETAKAARLSPEDRVLVRLARSTGDQVLRNKLLRLLSGS